MTEHSKEPPELPGEVWRGDGEAVMLDAGVPVAMFWWGLSGASRWIRYSPESSQASAIFCRWALDLSARCSAALAASDLGAKMAREAEGRAERAEAIFKAERALRKADFQRVILTGANISADDPMVRRLVREGNDAEHALLALGVTP